jgi:hypothetical protein
MTSALVQRFRDDVAPRLMAELGSDGVEVVVRVVEPNHDPLLPPATIEQSSPVKAYATGVSAQMVAADPNLQATDLRVIVAAVDYAPAVGHMVNVNDDARRVIRVDAIPANGLPAIYWMYVR